MGGIPDSSVAAAAEAALRKTLDGLLRTIKQETDQQQNALAFSNRLLEGEYQDKLISLGNFYDDQSNIRKRALQVQLDEQDRIIAAEQAFLRATKNPASKIEAQSRIDEAKQTKTGLQVRFGQDEQIALQQRARDVLALENAFAGVNAQVLDLQENFAAAAAVKFDLQFDVLKKTFTAEGNEAGKEAIKTLRAATIAQAEFHKVSLLTQRTLDDLANAETRVAIAEQTGAIGSLEALAKLGEARQKQIPVLEAQVAAAEALAAIEKAKGTAGADDLARKAEALRLNLDKLKASADPLAESLNKTFGQDFNNALDDFVTGTKSAADAFKAFAKSVLNDILKLGSKSITESIFGGSGGVGGFISSLFKTQGADTSGGAASDVPTQGAVDAITKLFSDTGSTAAKTAETASVTAATAAVSAMTAATTAAAAALTELAAASAVSSVSDSASSAADFASLFAGAFADGGVIPPGQWGVVGENGPELAFGGQNGQTIKPVAQGTTQNINVSVQGAPGQSRDSLLQQGAMIGQGIQRAMARNT